MTTYLKVRFLPVLAFALLAVLGVVGVASAAPPSDGGSFPLNLPNCMAGQDTGHICKVSPALASFIGQPVTWQATTGQWIVIRLGWADPDPAICSATQASLIVTITLDGRQLPVDTFQCQASNGQWVVDYRTLVHPLAPGGHSISVTSYFPVAVGYPGDFIPGGYTQTDDTALTVVP
jgi:hypothetical protein